MQRAVHRTLRHHVRPDWPGQGNRRVGALAPKIECPYRNPRPPRFAAAGFWGKSTMTATTKLKDWQRAATGRKLYWGHGLIAMADGDRSVCATGADAETAARACLQAWYSGREQAA